MSKRIGFLGAGRMAQALAKGFLQAGVASAQDLLASDVSVESRQAMQEAAGIEVVDDNIALAKRSQVIFVAVKPQVVESALSTIESVVSSKHLIVSIAAGVSLARLEKILGKDVRLIRVMPNTPCLVSAAASAFASGKKATDEDVTLVKRLLESVGVAYSVSESSLDAVTGLSGSGPAYVYQVIEALSDGGVHAGLPRDIATALAAQTVLGAAKMVLETKVHPGQLKDMVTSPAGTTIAGLRVLEQRGVRSAFLDAVVAASQRSKELGGS